MRERPILFSAPMVRAILAGTKTQTRRVVMGAPEDWAPMQPQVFAPTLIDRHGDEQPGPDAYGAGNEEGDCWIRCPYGQPGDLLWVREAWRAFAAFNSRPPRDITSGPVWHEAQDQVPFHPTAYGKLRPSIHMPRWASRITMEITGVRVERLQDISEADAVAEGVFTDPACPAYDAYRSLWESIHGPGSWDANPWVWVIEFQRVGQQDGGREGGGV